MTAVEPTTHTNTPTAGTRSRRDVLCGLMVALVAPGALVAACSSEDSPSGNTGGDQGAGNETGGGGGQTGQTLIALSEVPDGGGVIADGPDGPVVVVRTGSEVKAYAAACTHMGTTVSAPADGVATCPNHGSQFAMSDGSVKKGPATQPLPTIAVKIEGDQVVLA